MSREEGQGMLLLDRYVLQEEIASGGMAAVHFGRTMGIGGFVRAVAIKRLHPQFAKDPDFVSMFLDEARLAARVRHPNVVPTLDVVATEGELFLVMEYVAGESLDSLHREALRQGGCIPVRVAASVMSGALYGLHAAHEARDQDGVPLEIVHRDVTPHNIMVGEDGVARVLDFGIARAAVRSHATREGHVKGKLRYMAPEQLHGATATRHADIYSAGVVLWESLTGRRLFMGDTDAAVYGQVLEGVVAPPTTYAEIPRALDAVVLRALDRDPSRRFATAHEMANALEQAAPPATAREVADWLALVAGASLKRRAQRVAMLEGKRVSMESLSNEPPLVKPETTVTSTDLRPEGFVEEEETGQTPAMWVPPPLPSAAPAISNSSMPVAPSSAPRSDAGTGMIPTATLEARAPVRSNAASRAMVAIGALAIVASAAVVASRALATRAASAQRGIAERALLLMLRARSEETPERSDPAPSATPTEDPPAPSDTAPARRPGPRPTSSAHAKPQCDPPYYVDATGIRRVKRECL